MQKYIKKFIAAAVVAIIVVAIFILSKFQNICEFMVQNVYGNYSKVVASITSHFSFSIFEVLSFLLALIVLLIIIFMFINIKKKNKEKALNNFATLLVMVLSFTMIYNLLTSFMYNRKTVPIDRQVELIDDAQSFEYAKLYLEQLNNLANMNELNEDGTTMCPYKDNLDMVVLSECNRLLQDEYFITTSAKPKKIISSYLMSAFGVSGITFVPLVEPCYNKDEPQLNQAFTIAHEIAHTKGVMVENKANELAYFVLMNSENKYLKYAGYLFALSYVRDVFVLTNNYDYYKNYEFAVNVYADLEYINDWWEKHNKMEKVGAFVNNLYLKANNQEGVSSYYSYAEYVKYYDKEQDKTVYQVKRYSDIQNMIFKTLSKI